MQRLGRSRPRCRHVSNLSSSLCHSACWLGLLRESVVLGIDALLVSDIVGLSKTTISALARGVTIGCLGRRRNLAADRACLAPTIPESTTLRGFHRLRQGDLRLCELEHSKWQDSIVARCCAPTLEQDAFRRNRFYRSDTLRTFANGRACLLVGLKCSFLTHYLRGVG